MNTDKKNTFSFADIFIRGESQYVLWGMVGRGLGAFNALITIASLSSYQYGVFQLFLALRAIFADFISISSATFGNEIVRFIGEKKEAQAKRVYLEYNSIRLFMGTCLFLLFYFGAPYMNFRYADNFIEILRIISLFFLADALLATVSSLLSIRFYFGSIISRGVVEKLMQSFVLLYFLFFSRIGVAEVFISFIVGLFVSILFLIPPAIRAYYPWVFVPAAQGKFLFIHIFNSHGKWEFMKTFASKLIARLQPWLIKFFVSTEAVGIYSIATNILGVLKSLMPANTIGAMIPRIIHEKERMWTIFVYISKYYFWLSVILMIGAATVTPIGIVYFFPGHVAALPIFYALLLELPMQAFLRPIDNMLIALRSQKFFFLRTVSRSIISIILLLLLLPWLRLWGVVISYLAYVYLVTFVSYQYLTYIEPKYHIPVKIIFSFTNTDRMFFKVLKDRIFGLLHKNFMYNN